MGDKVGTGAEGQCSGQSTSCVMTSVRKQRKHRWKERREGGAGGGMKEMLKKAG